MFWFLQDIDFLIEDVLLSVNPAQKCLKQF